MLTPIRRASGKVNAPSNQTIVSKVSSRKKETMWSRAGINWLQGLMGPPKMTLWG